MSLSLLFFSLSEDFLIKPISFYRNLRTHCGFSGHKYPVYVSYTSIQLMYLNCIKCYL